MEITTENFLLIGAILLFVAVLAGKLAYRLGTPALLLFLGVGVFFGYDILSFNSPELTQFMGMIALSIILFSGGMDTKFSEIRSVMLPGVILATVGVLITALIFGNLYLRHLTVVRCRAELPARPTPCLNNGIYRLGIGILDFANQEAGSYRASTPVA